jgi:hypothetical protein
MRDFKFFQNNQDGWECASWIWRTIPRVAQYQIVIEEHYGIRSFLSQFSSHEIISVNSIIGPDGVVRNRHNEGIGWGFDISTDLIKITWIRFID